MEIIGFLLMVLVSCGAVLLPFFLIALSGLGGGMTKGDWGICVLIWSLAASLWYFTITNSPFSVVIN